jgi:hypothetical protein
MPISREDFESGHTLNDLENSIISFLEKDRSTAFSPSEIMDGINYQRDYSDLLTFTVAGNTIYLFPQVLNNLVATGKIRYNIIEGEHYYMAK